MHYDNMSGTYHDFGKHTEQVDKAIFSSFKSCMLYLVS